jgi:hypothetical protein
LPLPFLTSTSPTRSTRFPLLRTYAPCIHLGPLVGYVAYGRFELTECLAQPPAGRTFGSCRSPNNPLPPLAASTPLAPSLWFLLPRSSPSFGSSPTRKGTSGMCVRFPFCGFLGVLLIRFSVQIVTPCTGCCQQIRQNGFYVLRRRCRRMLFHTLTSARSEANPDRISVGDKHLARNKPADTYRPLVDTPALFLEFARLMEVADANPETWAVGFLDEC